MRITRSATLILVSALSVSSPLSVLAATRDDPTKVVGHPLEFQSGGTTEASIARMATAARENGYDLQIHMDGTLGEQWRRARVTVNNDDGKPVLQAEAGGPLFYARLPEGRYTVDVREGDQDAMARDVWVSPDQPAKVDLKLSE
ncbi:MAG: hypothetical protein KDK91_15515 [Gammaproteobacteria bacterium]|nr:hypothetical protein [Gammaproteobacteria bacterium]